MANTSLVGKISVSDKIVIHFPLDKNTMVFFIATGCNKWYIT
jgi:hypothetical protein